jgi:hypothetical protein
MDVDEHDVRLESMDLRQRFRPRRRHADHVESTAPEERGRSVEERPVVIDDEQTQGHATSVPDRDPIVIAGSRKRVRALPVTTDGPPDATLERIGKNAVRSEHRESS